MLSSAQMIRDEGIPSSSWQSKGVSHPAPPLVQPPPVSESGPACRPLWRGSGRRQSPNTRLVPQPADPHLRGLSLSGDMFHHVIRWNVIFFEGAFPSCSGVSEGGELPMRNEQRRVA